MTDETLDSSTSLAGDVFGRLFQGLRNAVNDFQNEATPENLTKLIAVVGAYGATGSKVWSEVSRFARKHPVPSALGAAVLFLAVRGLMNSSASPQEESQWKMQNYH